MLFPGTSSASPPILSVTTAANKFAIAVAPVQPGSPILTFSAKLEKEDSEFDIMKIEREFINDFHAPFVKKSEVKIGLKKSDSILLPNGCTLIIGNVELVVFPENSINELGQLDLETYSCAGISGLNTYYGLKKLNSFPYVRNDEIPDFK